MLKRMLSKKSVQQKETGLEDWVFEAVISFMHSPLWEVPVMNFIDLNCAVFDSEEENKLSYTQIHIEYKELIEQLLTQHLGDMGVSVDEFVAACGVASDRLSVTVMDQILSCDDFLAFRGMMLARNIDLQNEAIEDLAREAGIQLNRTDAPSSADAAAADDSAAAAQQQKAAAAAESGKKKPALRWLRRKARKSAAAAEKPSGQQAAGVDKTTVPPADGSGDGRGEDDEEWYDEDAELARALEESRLMEAKREEILREREEAELNIALMASMRLAERQHTAQDTRRIQQSMHAIEQAAPSVATPQSKGKLPTSPTTKPDITETGDITPEPAASDEEAVQVAQSTMTMDTTMADTTTAAAAADTTTAADASDTTTVAAAAVQKAIANAPVSAPAPLPAVTPASAKLPAMQHTVAAALVPVVAAKTAAATPPPPLLTGGNDASDAMPSNVLASVPRDAAAVPRPGRVVAAAVVGKPSDDEVRRRAEHLRAQRDMLRRKREAERNTRLAEYSATSGAAANKGRESNDAPSTSSTSMTDLPPLPAKKSAHVVSQGQGARADLTRQLAKDFTSPSA